MTTQSGENIPLSNYEAATIGLQVYDLLSKQQLQNIGNNNFSDEDLSECSISSEYNRNSLKENSYILFEICKILDILKETEKETYSEYEARIGCELLLSPRTNKEKVYTLAEIMKLLDDCGHSWSMNQVTRRISDLYRTGVITKFAEGKALVCVGVLIIDGKRYLQEKMVGKANRKSSVSYQFKVKEENLSPLGDYFDLENETASQKEVRIGCEYLLLNADPRISSTLSEIHELLDQGGRFWTENQTTHRMLDLYKKGLISRYKNGKVSRQTHERAK